MLKKKTDAGGILLAYEEFGEGPPVVLLHGFAMSSLVWRELIPLLGEDYRWLVPDLRGHGQSDVPDGPYSMEAMADDIAGFLDSLGIERTVLLGHSMGGFVTAAFVERHPHRLAGFGLIHSTPGAEDEVTKERRLEKLRELGYGELVPYAASLASKLLQPAQLITLLKDWKLVMETADEFHLHGAIHAVEGIAARKDRTRVLAEAQVPVLVINGAIDPIILPERPPHMIAASITAITLEGIGHLVMLQAPERLAQAILDFLDAFYSSSKKGNRSHESH
jgi:3-oxoadipate enol-lactonase